MASNGQFQLQMPVLPKISQTSNTNMPPARAFESPLKPSNDRAVI